MPTTWTRFSVPIETLHQMLETQVILVKIQLEALRYLVLGIHLSIQVIVH